MKKLLAVLLLFLALLVFKGLISSKPVYAQRYCASTGSFNARVYRCINFSCQFDYRYRVLYSCQPGGEAGGRCTSDCLHETRDENYCYRWSTRVSPGSFCNRNGSEHGEGLSTFCVNCWVNTCGNGNCEPQYGENSSNCPQDCRAAATPTPTPTPTPPPSCTADLTPATTSISVGASTDFFATVVPTNGTVGQVNFSSSNTGVATVNPASDASSPYQTSATGVSIGSATVTSNVVMSGAVRCTDTSSLEVVSPGPWWQVQDADIITNGNLFSLIPTITCLLPGCNPIFGLEGLGGYPGVPSYGGSYDFEAGSGTGTVSSTGWLVNTTTTFNKVYNYSYFQALMRPEVIINEIIEPEIQGGYLVSQGNATGGEEGYVWFRRQGDLTITGTANLQTRKVVLLVDGDLYLGRPPAQSGSSIRVRDGTGFFMAIVSGDIIISPKAEINPLDPQPVFEGIFLAEGQVKTGTEGPALDEQLWIRGSVAAYGGVVLERDLTDNSLTPAEFFEYGPDLLFTFPRDLTSRKYKWKEIAP